MKNSLLVLILITILFKGLASECAAKVNQTHRWEDKLSSNLIIEIEQDSYGFIWIATQNGLNRFDGWKFINYFHDEQDSTSLAGNMVRKLLTDSNGRLWVGTNNGLQYYCPYEDTFHYITFPNSSSPSISDIIELHTGEIGVVTSGYGAFIVNPETLETTYLEWITKLCNTLFMNCIYEDSSNNLWIAYVGNNLACISQITKTAQTYTLPHSPSPKVYDIIEDNNGHLFISTHEHFFLKENNNNRLTPIKYKAHTIVDTRTMIKCRNGRILVNSDTYGVLYLDTIKMELHSIENSPDHIGNLTKGKTKVFIEDRDGNLWIHSRQNGVSIIPNQPFQFNFWDFSNINPDGYISVIYKDKEKNIWIGCTDGSLYNVDRIGKIKKSYQIPKYVCSMLEDSNGIFWLGTQYGGILQFNKQTGEYVSFPLYKNETVSQIIEGKDKTLYFSLPGTGFMSYNPKNNTTKLPVVH